MTACMVLLVLFVAAAFVVPLLGGSSNTANTSALRHAVLTSVQTSEGAKTVDVTFSATISGDGTSGTVESGSGEIDFADDSAELSLRPSPSPTSDATMTEIRVGGNQYVSIPGMAQMTGGKTWLEEPLPSSASSTFGEIDPSDLFANLTAQGDTVTPLGPSTIDGVAVEGYSVSVNLQSMLQHAAGSEGTSPSDQKFAQSLFSLVGSTSVTMEVFVESGTDLLRRVVLSVSISHKGKSGSIGMDEDFTNYGAAVDIAAPPTNEVESAPQALQGPESAITPGSATQTTLP